MPVRCMVLILLYKINNDFSEQKLQFSHYLQQNLMQTNNVFAKKNYEHNFRLLLNIVQVSEMW